MRKAAAIFLFVTAIMNILRGVAYLGLGQAAVDDSVVVKDRALEGAKQDDPSTDTPGDVEPEDAVSPVFWMVFGGFLLVLSGLQILGGVLLWVSKLKSVIFGMAVLSVAAECVGLVNIGFLPWQLFGLIGGLLAFVGAMGIGKDEPAAADAPAG